MTETTCPTCGVKCLGKGEYTVERYVPFPQPDLTQLREAYQGLEDFANDHNLYGLSRYTAITAQTGVVLREVKKLLEQETK